MPTAVTEWIDLDQQWDARLNRSTEHTAGTRAVEVVVHAR